MSAGPVTALLLDALGTIVELPPPAPALQEELACRFGLEVTEGQAQAAIMAEIAYYRARFDDARDMVALHGLRRNCAEVLRAALPRSEALDAVPTDALVQALLASLRFRAYPDARPAIAAVRARGLRVVVASNWDVSLPHVLADIGLAPLVDGIVCSAQLGARKPDAAVFAAALRVAGAGPGEALHVGDSLGEDIGGAQAAGLRAVLIMRGPPAPKPPGTTTIASLSELGALI